MVNVIPSDISVCFARRDSNAAISLLPEEEAICANWRSADRKMLFRLGRVAAHDALKKLGFDAQRAVLRGGEGEPLWPEGYVGSISNTAGTAVAVAACRDHYASLGVDIELKTRTIRSDTANFICTESELALAQQAKLPLLRLFSAKECFYKALSPLWNHFISFKDVSLSWDPNDCFWNIISVSDHLPSLPWGKYRIYSLDYEELILSIIWLPLSSL